jgi:Protein of unknown function (DUF2911)
VKPLPLIAAGLVLLLGATFVVTGVSLIPPTLALGPCLKDWTSPVSYRPRASPMGSVRLRLNDATVQLCYGRPAARGRTVFGRLVPYDSLWRLGANEPTRLSVNRAISLAGIPLPPGRYSLYASPRPDAWTVFVSRSTLHWGNDISPEVRSREVGQAVVPVELLAEPVETLTVQVEDQGSSDRARLVFDWERTRVGLDLARPGVPPNLGAHP